jgi:hypothetical protein
MPGIKVKPAGVDHPLGLTPHLANIDDAAVLNRNIGPPRLIAQPIDDRRAADHQIIHADLPS